MGFSGLFAKATICKECLENKSEDPSGAPGSCALCGNPTSNKVYTVCADCRLRNALCSVCGQLLHPLPTPEDPDCNSDDC